MKNSKESVLPIKAVMWLLCCMCCSFVPRTLTAGVEQSAALLRDTIVSLNKARESISDNELNKPELSQRSENSREDVLLFLSYLDGRIYYYCQELFLVGGPEGLAGLPCPSGSGSMFDSSLYDPVPDSSGQTSGEKVAELEGDFNAALGEFDDMLLKEQETIAAHIPRQRENSGSGSSPSGAEQGLPAGQDPGQQPSTGQAGGATTSQTGTPEESASQEDARGGGSIGSGKGKKNPSTLPPTDGQKEISKDDDDIVARQLREAAEQETDPEIKAKLWEEYRKYKEGIT